MNATTEPIRCPCNKMLWECTVHGPFAKPVAKTVNGFDYCKHGDLINYYCRACTDEQIGAARASLDALTKERDALKAQRDEWERTATDLSDAVRAELAKSTEMLEGTESALLGWRERAERSEEERDQLRSNVQRLTAALQRAKFYVNQCTEYNDAEPDADRWKPVANVVHYIHLVDKAICDELNSPRSSAPPVATPCPACGNKPSTCEVCALPAAVPRQACGPIFYSPWDEQQTQEEHDNVACKRCGLPPSAHRLVAATPDEHRMTAAEAGVPTPRKVAIARAVREILRSGDEPASSLPSVQAPKDAQAALKMRASRLKDALMFALADLPHMPGCPAHPCVDPEVCPEAHVSHQDEETGDEISPDCHGVCICWRAEAEAAVDEAKDENLMTERRDLHDIVGVAKEVMQGSPEAYELERLRVLEMVRRFEEDHGPIECGVLF